MGELEIELLGAFRVTVGGQEVAPSAWRRRKPAALLKLLALAPGHRLHREQAMDALWPELDPAAASANLRKAIHHARGALEGAAAGASALIISDGDFITLPPAGFALDVARFRSTLASARRAGATRGVRTRPSTSTEATSFPMIATKNGHSRRDVICTSTFSMG